MCQEVAFHYKNMKMLGTSIYPFRSHSNKLQGLCKIIQEERAMGHYEIKGLTAKEKLPCPGQCGSVSWSVIP